MVMVHLVLCTVWTMDHGLYMVHLVMSFLCLAATWPIGRGSRHGQGLAFDVFHAKHSFEATNRRVRERMQSETPHQSVLLDAS